MVVIVDSINAYSTSLVYFPFVIMTWILLFFYNQ